ncbi:MAG TPA: thiamine pyrophosphate-dependent enzyme [Anaerolineales bacterium]|nr:thiamine pyrophosphate-dependent enzyme [Anaerolineales bacterium]
MNSPRSRTREKKEKSDAALAGLDPEEILADYRLAYRSRQVSLSGRREVMSGKAKFGIFGDGKELAQIAMAKAFRKGDFRSGYYRDQTFMFAVESLTIQQFFAQLYAHVDIEADPASAGRAMNAHFGTRSLYPDGSWKDLTGLANSSADVSPTGSQMPRLVGLGYASRLYRELDELHGYTQFSNNGDEIAFGTIGNATTAEGMFWEAINAIGVLQAPVLLSIWDDGFGISVTNEYQMVKQDIFELLEGFRREPGPGQGFDLYQVKGWDYPALINMYLEAARKVRAEHIPAIVHVIELTQPQGHSTSGSQERYKSRERLDWEQAFDCLTKFRQYILDQALADREELVLLEKEEQQNVEAARREAWRSYLTPIHEERRKVASILENIASNSRHSTELTRIREKLASLPNPLRRDIMAAVIRTLTIVRDEALPVKKDLIAWKAEQEVLNEDRYSSHLYNQSGTSAIEVAAIPAQYSEESPSVHGHEVLNACFDAAFAREPRLIAFGEDVGKLGDVNQGMRGLQEKYGPLRVSDTGIRETTIIGQAIGMAMRGLRPIAEIQYLDYLPYALQIMSDDLATLHWRTKGGQIAPVIVRTRGHRLEGIWHSGSLMAGIIHLVRGMHVLVPRDMTQAAGFYNTLFRSEDPALLVEVLNGYRLKERLPDNIGEFTVPLGVPEVIREGSDVTLVTYGACCRIALEAAELLRETGIDIEIVDVQTLLPFDIHGGILESLKKTSRIIFVDEDVPGGTTAYMLQEVIEKQGGYFWLDGPPRTLSGKPHRPAYGSDGDYWSKPNAEQIFQRVYEMMHESDPSSYPVID